MLSNSQNCICHCLALTRRHLFKFSFIELCYFQFSTDTGWGEMHQFDYRWFDTSKQDQNERNTFQCFLLWRGLGREWLWYLTHVSFLEWWQCCFNYKYCQFIVSYIQSICCLLWFETDCQSFSHKGWLAGCQPNSGVNWRCPPCSGNGEIFWNLRGSK